MSLKGAIKKDGEGHQHPDLNKVREKLKEKQTFTMKIDKDLLSRFKIKCIENKKTMSDVVVDFMQTYIE
jgi:cell fate (sporulation/competence/biofilm development) regulator YlbF (YheA/YmcA/DUF963 family)